jgi:hypothetical protein
VAALVVLTAGAAGCGSLGDDPGDRATATSEADTTTATTAPAAPAAPVDGSPAGPGPQPLPPAPALPTVAAAGPAPATVTIDALDVAGAPVRAVGVEAGGDMEIPGVHEVGWYRFGSRPGEPGSTLLAAHIAYGGVDGVFRHLGDLRAGDAVELGLDDGTVRRFVVTALAQYPKAELPAEVFARRGEPRLVLVTCGGAFDPDARHYEDNVVAYARPT